MDDSKISEIIVSLSLEIETLRNLINTDDRVVCSHATCDACNQRNIELNAEKDSMMIQLREKESLIHKLSE